MVEKQSTDRHWSWIPAVALWILVMASLIWLSFVLGENEREIGLSLSIILGFTVLAWPAGTFISPDTDKEARNFSKLWRGVTIFASGYLVSKIDPIVTKTFSTEFILSENGTTLFRLLAALSSFVVSTMTVYFVRIYGFGIGVSIDDEKEPNLVDKANQNQSVVTTPDAARPTS